MNHRQARQKQVMQIELPYVQPEPRQIWETLPVEARRTAIALMAKLLQQEGVRHREEKQEEEHD